MKQRKMKLAMLCITAALLTTANAEPVAARELKYNQQTTDGWDRAKPYAGISAVTASYQTKIQCKTAHCS